MSFDSLFKLKPDMTLEISKQANGIPEYKAVIVRSKNVRGDMDGRKKYFALAELLFCYHMVHPASIAANLPYKEKRLKALTTSGMDKTSLDEFKEDNITLAAMERMKEDIRLTATGNAYYAAQNSLFSLAEDINYMQKQCDNLKELLKEKVSISSQDKVIKLEDINIVKECMGIIKEISSIQTEIGKNIEKLPKLKKIVDELASQLAAEEGGKIIPVGGRELGNREMPK